MTYRCDKYEQLHLSKQIIYKAYHIYSLSKPIYICVQTLMLVQIFIRNQKMENMDNVRRGLIWIIIICIIKFLQYAMEIYLFMQRRLLKDWSFDLEITSHNVGLHRAIYLIPLCKFTHYVIEAVQGMLQRHTTEK